MFQYEPADSPHYFAHEAYCKRVIKEIELHQGKVTGFCNSFGYTMVTSMQDQYGEIAIEINKFQTPRNGYIIPLDALESVRVSITLYGADKNIKCHAGHSVMMRWFTAKIYKQLLPAPTYFNGNISPQSILWLVPISRFKLNVNDGVIYYQQYSAPEDLMRLVEDLREMGIGY